MFDDRLFETIMGEMIKEFGPDVRTDEGSLAYNACVRIALKLEEVYGDMDEINENLLPDTMDDSHLIRYGEERGVPYNYATNAIVKAHFTQSIELGERFLCGDYSYTVTELISGYDYKLECETEGTAPNATLGELTPIDFIDDWAGGSITQILVPGEDDEDIEEYRVNVINTFKSVAFGGNKADYRTFINAIDGVGGCKPCRRASNSHWINIYIISSDHTVPSDTLVTAVQTAVDPEQSHGEGDGIAPICHEVSVIGVTGVNVNIKTHITIDEGYPLNDIKNKILTEISSYLADIRTAWESKEFDSTIVRISQIDTKILSVDGVLDVEGTKINNGAGNLTLDYKSIPILGGITYV